MRTNPPSFRSNRGYTVGIFSSIDGRMLAVTLPAQDRNAAAKAAVQLKRAITASDVA